MACPLCLTELSKRQITHALASEYHQTRSMVESLRSVTVLWLLASYRHVRALLSGGNSVEHLVKLRVRGTVLKRESLPRECTAKGLAGKGWEPLPRLSCERLGKGPVEFETQRGRAFARVYETSTYWTLNPDVVQTSSLHSAITM